MSEVIREINKFRYSAVGGVEYMAYYHKGWYRLTGDQMLQMTAEQLRLIADAMETE